MITRPHPSPAGGSEQSPESHPGLETKRAAEGAVAVAFHDGRVAQDL
jgi:hypothetical protein